MALTQVAEPVGNLVETMNRLDGGGHLTRGEGGGDHLEVVSIDVVDERGHPFSGRTGYGADRTSGAWGR